MLTFDSIVQYLRDQGKTKDDVRLVSFYVGNYLQTRRHFRCTMDEFLDSVGGMDIDLVAWKDFAFVADDWWVIYKHGGFKIYQKQYVPHKYKIPTKVDLCTKECAWTVREHDSHA